MATKRKSPTRQNRKPPKKYEPTAYRRMMEKKRKEAKDAQKFNKAGLCWARKRSGDHCRHQAGWGTTHPGIGKCRLHGGAVPSHVAHAAKESAILMGAPIDINPLDALVWCIKLTAGEVEFCSKQMEILSEHNWTEETIMGEQLHLWARERQKAVERLAKFSKDALAVGLAERAVRLAEQYGQSIAKYTNGIIGDLTPFISPEGIKQVPLIVRKHLALLEGGGPVVDADRRNLPALPRRVA